MAGFLYWLETEKKGLSAEMIREAGLTHVWPEAKPEAGRRECRRGPSGGGGLVLVRGEHDGELGYFPDRQQWEDCGGFWLGWEAGRLPAASDLLRSDAYLDRTIVLDLDGEAWAVAPANPMDDVTALPHRHRPGANGERWSVEVLPEYRRYQELVRIAWGLFVECGANLVAFGAAMDDAVTRELAIRALGVCYHVGEWEAWALGLTQNRIMGRIVVQVMNGERVRAAMESAAKEAEAAEKKTDDGGQRETLTSCDIELGETVPVG